MTNIIDGLIAYAMQTNRNLFQSSKTAILMAKDAIYTPKGATTKIRQVVAGKAGTYDKLKGFLQTYGSGDSVEWKEYQAKHDRVKVHFVDAMDELASFQAGMDPSINVLNTDFLENEFSDEFDKSNISEWYAAIPGANTHLNSEAGWKTGKVDILETLVLLENALYSSGVNGKSYVFIKASIYAGLQLALVGGYGIANPNIIKNSEVIEIDTGLQELDPETDGKLKITIDTLEFGNLILIRVPDSRMITKVLYFDGVSTGQEAGGVVADTEETGYGEIDLIAIPKNAGFADIRYSVNNFLVPSQFYGNDFSLDMNRITSRVFGAIEISNAGINQKANAFEIDNRIIYGADLFANRAKNCFAIHGALET